MKKGQKSKMKSVCNFTKAEDAKSRLRQFFSIMLQADKARMSTMVNKETDRSASACRTI